MQEGQSKVRTQKPEKLREGQNRGKLEAEAPPTLLQPPRNLFIAQASWNWGFWELNIAAVTYGKSKLIVRETLRKAGTHW